MSLAALAAASAALADEQIGSQNLGASVTVGLKSSGLNPEVATAGDTIRAEAEVSSSIFEQLSYVRVFLNTDWAGSGSSPDFDRLLKLRPGKTVWDWRAKWHVSDKTPPGIYHLNIAALSSAGIDPSVATATITVVN